MKPIQDILNRIRWDKEFASAEFTLGYYDRVTDKVLLVPFRECYFDDDDHFAFQIIDAEGVTHNIPLHRIRSLHQNGKLIWQR